ncbi:MAG: type II toxin-antitoxin system HicA family toxin [Methyloglobulus sp.]|nr:type II toxin-antitoxin system HicA family toxin [Methyloglobulus sp.]
MSKKDKLIEKLKSESEFTWDELERLMAILNFIKIEGAGSRVKFFHKETNTIINLHKPHPDKAIKDYVRKEILARLKNEFI